jgi:NADH-quinone oxidoreductase subunit H
MESLLPLLAPLIKIAILIGFLMTAAAYFVLLERRMAAWVQDRIGPNRVGIPLTKIRLFGLGQPLADGLKFIFKEEYTPAHVEKKLYLVAPIAILAAALTTFAAVPFGSSIPPFKIGPIESKYPIELSVSSGLSVGILLVFALSSIAVYGVILGGWASNNKYSFLGGLRSSAQLIAYELPLSLGILGVLLAAGSLDLQQIIHAQAGGMWYALAQPLGFIVFTVAAFAEAARLPFDLPEAEQELVGGYHTEYAGLKLLLFLVAEFLHMILASYLIVILFLGGWHFPFVTGAPDAEITWPLAIIRALVLNLKVFGVIVFFMLVRWSWPRFRFDQLMALAWKVMLPLGIVNFVAVAIFMEARTIWGPESFNLAWDGGLALASWAVCVLAWAAVGAIGPIVADNRPRLSLSPGDVDAQLGFEPVETVRRR